MASSVIQQTDLAAALLELAEDEVHFLYTNEAYRQELLLLHSTPQEAEKALNNAKDPATYDTFRESVQNARRSQKPETYFYVDNGSYIRICLEVVLEYNGHTLIRTDIKNITKNREWLEHVRFDQNLRYLYILFDNIHIVHLDRDTIEPLFLQDPQDTTCCSKNSTASRLSSIPSAAAISIRTTGAVILPIAIPLR